MAKVTLFSINSRPPANFVDGAKAFAGKACGTCASVDDTNPDTHINCETTLGKFAESIGVQADMRDQATRNVLSGMLKQRLSGQAPST
jgi:hypothetical protein